MKGFLLLLETLLRMVLVSLALSVPFTLVAWIISLIKEREFHFAWSFFGGAAGIFALYVIICIVKTIKTMRN